MLKPSVPPEWEKRLLVSLASYLQVLQPGALLRYLAWVKAHRRDADEIEAQISGRGTIHRIRLRNGFL